MELEKLLSSFEKLFYNVAALIVLIPITIFNLFKSYKFPSQAIEEEFSKGIDERFKKNISPVLLLVICFVLPVILFQEYKTMVSDEKQDFSMGMGFLSRTLFLAVCVNFFPLLSAVYVLMVQKRTVNTDNLARPYYAFMYSFAYPLLWIGIVFFAFTQVDVFSLEPDVLEANLFWMDGVFKAVFFLAWGLSAVSIFYTFRHTGLFSRQRAILATCFMIGIMFIISQFVEAPI